MNCPVCGGPVYEYDYVPSGYSCRENPWHTVNGSVNNKLWPDGSKREPGAISIPVLVWQLQRMYGAK